MSKRPVVLIVEDEIFLRIAAIDMIQRAGFTAIDATDATAAVKLLDSHLGINVIFTDVEMPHGVNGLELAALVKDRWPAIHIIITSGKAEIRREPRPDDSVFFDKPYDETHVIAEMRRMLGQG